MKSNFSWMLLLGVVACQPPQKLVTEKWLTGHQRFVVDRMPAAGSNPECRKDLFTVEEVKREALYYEQKLDSNKKVVGTWKHLNLAKLPVPQARFLQLVGKSYGDLKNPPDISSCGDVPCVVNKVYGSTDGLEGWTTYLWYLKMGSILTFKNWVYDQKSSSAGEYNGKVYPLSDYLYSRDELYAFWRMSHALTNPYKTLPELKEINRVPRKSTIEDMGPMTCGLAWSTGYILLNDGCLSFSYTGVDAGFIYEGATHEMGHQIDYQWGRRDRTTYFSDNGKWREMGGWSQSEYYDQVEQKTVRKWVSTLRDDQFVRSYAKNSPIEHFADTLAYFRYQGDMTKKKIPTDIYDFIRDEVFEQQEFDAKGLYGQFERDVTQLLASDVFKAAVECDQSPVAQTSTVPLAADLFPFNVAIPVRKCLREKLQQIVDQSVVEAKLNHVDGCQALKGNDKVLAFRTQMERALSVQMVNHLKASRENQEYYRRLNEFYKQLAERAAPLRLMTGCYGEMDEKSCYEAAINEFVEGLLPADLQNAQNFREDLKKMFVDSNRFESVRAEMFKVHQDFVLTQTASLDTAAGALWKECRAKSYSDAEAPVPGPFSVGENWMVSSQFNCLSFDIPTRVREVVSQMSFDALGVTDGKEARLLFDTALPFFVKEIRRLYEADEVAERQAITKVLQSQRWREELSANFAWVSGLGGQIRKNCEDTLYAKVPRDLRYHRTSEAFGERISAACSEVMNSDAFRKWLNSQQGMVEEHVLNTYLERLEVLGDAQAKKCVRDFPMRTVLERLKNKKAREKCLDDDWIRVSLAAWQESLALVGSTLKVDRAAIMQKADLPSKRLLGKIKRENFVD